MSARSKVVEIFAAIDRKPMDILTHSCYTESLCSAPVKKRAQAFWTVGSLLKELLGDLRLLGIYLQ